LDDDASLRELYAVYVSDLAVLEGSTAGGDWVYFRCAASQLQGHVEDMSGVMPCQRSRQMVPVCFVEPAIAERLEASGFEKLTALDVLLWRLEGFLGLKAHEFFGVQETSAWLERIRKTHPALVEELIPHRFTLSKIAEVLRMLLEEGIPIIDMVSVLETIGEKALECYDTPFLVEAIRLVTRRRWLSQLAAPREPLMVATLAPDVEHWFHERQYDRDVAGELAVNTVEGKRLLDMLKGYVFLFDRSLRPILLVSQPIRRYVWEYMSPYMPEIMVFSFVEFGAADYKVIQQVHFPEVDFEDFVHSLATEDDLSQSTEDDLPAAYAQRPDFVPRHPGPEPSFHSSFPESEPDDEEPVGRGLLGRARRRVRRLGQQILKRIEEN
jgi:flagellar biosynthesis component FlhA